MKLRAVTGALLTLIFTSMAIMAFNPTLATPNIAETSASPALDIKDTMDNNWIMSGEHGADGSAEYGYSTDVYTSAPTSIFAYIRGWGARGQDTAEVEIYKTFSWEPSQALRRLKLNYMIGVMTDGDAWGGMAALAWVKVITLDSAGEHTYSYIIAGGTTDVRDWSYNYCRERPNTKYINWNNDEIPAPGHGELEPPTDTWYTLDRDVDNDFDIDWSTVTEIKILFHLHGGYLSKDEFKVYFDDLQISTKEKGKLLIVTSRVDLTYKFGSDGYKKIYEKLEALGGMILDNYFGNIPEFWDSKIEEIGEEKIEKILIIGGDDVVPFGVLPNPVDDNDVLLTDDIYADFDHDLDTIIDVPIARIPDGNDLDLLMTQLSYRPLGTGGFTLANAKRPFASEINDIFGGDIYWSLPTRYENVFKENVNKKFDYFILHGSKTWASNWWGQENDYPLAFRTNEAASNGIVFSGACYGAYIENKTPANSICLRFLENGARCFIGSTGISYSWPDSSERANGLFAKLFFGKVVAGKEPLEAFYEAKVEFAEKMTHAVEQKLLHEYVFYGRP